MVNNEDNTVRVSEQVSELSILVAPWEFNVPKTSISVACQVNVVLRTSNLAGN